MASATGFFRLPRELRNMIYEFYVIVNGGYVCDTDAFIKGKLRTADGKPIDLALARTCRRIAGEMDGLALRLNTITFSTLCNDELRHLAGRFRELKPGLNGLDTVREEMFQFVGNCITDEADIELRNRYPQFSPLLDRIKQGPPQNFIGRHGPYGEAPSVYREFVKDTLRAAIVQRHQFLHDMQRFWRQLYSSLPECSLGPLAREMRATPLVLCTIESWAIPSDEDMHELLSFWHAFPQEMDPQALRYCVDDSMFRFSAAAAAIYFLQSIPDSTRKNLRRIILNEDGEAVANPECHARGLIPFCQENPLLQVERRINLWRNTFQVNHSSISSATRYYSPDRFAPCALYSDQVTVHVALWIAEALALVPAGMPPASFSLVLDGDPVPQLCSQIFQSVVQRDAAWQSAWEECLARGHISIAWFARKGENLCRYDHPRLDERGPGAILNPRPITDYPGYFFDTFPQAMKDIADNNSVVRCNFDPGTPWDVDSVVAQGRFWSEQTWVEQWPKHTPMYFDTVPPLPHWKDLLKENVVGGRRHQRSRRHR